MPTVCIDLSILRHPYCGLGQVAQNYGRWFAANAANIKDLDITLLVPKEHVGAFGGHNAYIAADDRYRLFPRLLPHFDLWHSIHQLSPFRPASSHDLRLTTIHDLNFIYEKKGRKKRRYLHRLQKEVDTSDALAFISQFAHDEAQHHLHFGNQPTKVIYNGVESGQDEADTPCGLEVWTGRKFMLCIGVVKEKKNLGVLLPLMRLMPEYELLLAGDDSASYAHALRQQAKQQHIDNLHFLGTVSATQRAWLYRHCEALLFPSLCEGFGLPIIEAMQHGKPVFASTATSLPEIGGSHAHYFDTFEPEAMLRTVKEGLASHTPETAIAEKDYAATFSYNRHLQHYLEYYRELLACRQ